MTIVVVIIIAAMFVIAISQTVAEKSGIASPIVLLLLGGIVALVPGMPEIEVEPELVLMIILPPLLFSSAVRMPVSDFRRNLLPISVLAFLLVAISAAVIGFVVNRMAPGIGVAACVALGAIVSPTDAVATSIVKEAGVSRRVVTVLEGEGLINDASALVILSSAIGAMASQVSAGRVIVDFLLAVLVAIVVGWLIGHLMIWLRSRTYQPTADTMLSVATPFLAFLPAEHLHGSGLVAAVAAGLVASHHSPRVLTPTQRMSSRNTWNSILLVLESAVFLMMGLELTAIVKDMQSESFGWQLAAGVAAAALVLTLVLRAAIMTPLLRLLSRRSRRHSRRRPRLESVTDRVDAAQDPEDGSMEFRGITLGADRVARIRTRLRRRISDLDYYIDHPLGPREGAVMIWAGMRGAITLAAAQTLPLDTPHRSFLVFVAFLVAAGSLLLQGSTLGLAVSLLKPAAAEGLDPHEQHEIRLLLRQAAREVPVPPVMRQLLAGADRRTAAGQQGQADQLADSDQQAGADQQAEPAHEDVEADENRVQAAAVALAWRQFAAMRDQPLDRDAERQQPAGPERPSRGSGTEGSGSPDHDTAGAGDQQKAVTSWQHRRRAAEISRNYALKLITTQRDALLDASDDGLFSPEAVSAALDTLDADQLSLEARSVYLD